MYKVITARYLKLLTTEANLLISQGYLPLGGVTTVATKHEFTHEGKAIVDFCSSTNNMLITFMQTFYKPQSKDL